jgi:Domain of unknown function (DUF4168)
MTTSINGSRQLGRNVLIQTATISICAAAGVLLGLVPSIQWQSSSPDSGTGLATVQPVLDFGMAAYAQSAVSDQEVMSYARSVMAIEPLRQSAYNDIERTNGSVPSILCHRPNSLNDLPAGIQQTARSYCNQSISIVEDNNLTITRFNEITVKMRSDSGLARRIQAAINQIR